MSSSHPSPHFSESGTSGLSLVVTSVAVVVVAASVVVAAVVSPTGSDCK